MSGGKAEAQKPVRLAENSANGQGRAHQEEETWKEGSRYWSIALLGAGISPRQAAQNQGFCLKTEGSGRKLNLQKGQLE